MAQIATPLFTDSAKMSQANAVAAVSKAKMNEVFIPQPVVRTTSRTS